MFGKIVFVVGLASAGLLLLVLNLTTPSNAGALGIFVVFLLAYSMTTAMVTFLIWTISKLSKRVSDEVRPARVRPTLTIRRSYYYASVIALAPVIIISLQSVGGVGIYEIMLVLLFVVLGCVYVAKRIQ